MRVEECFFSVGYEGCEGFASFGVFQGECRGRSGKLVHIYGCLIWVKLKYLVMRIVSLGRFC